MFDNFEFSRRSLERAMHVVGLLIATLGLIALATPSRAADATFSSPLYKGTRIDSCLATGSGCGRPAALAYCNARRFEDVADFRTEKARRAERMRLMGSGETCMGGENCTAFASITCTKKIPYRRIFANPAFDGVRVDVCLTDGGCGKPAADAFCRAKGHGDALYGRADPEPGRSATRLVDSGTMCKGPDCRGFQQIICRGGEEIEVQPAANTRARSFSASSSVEVFR